MTTIRIAIGQVNPTVGSFAANAEKIFSLASRAASQDRDLVIFPELALCGYPVWDLATNRAFVSEGLRSLAGLVRRTRRLPITVCLGFIDRARDGGAKGYNGACLFRQGKILLRQYKQLLPTYDVFLEQIFFRPGREQQLFSVKGVRAGVSICEDLWDKTYPVKPTRELARRGAKFIINISASPYHRDVEEIRRALIREKSRQNHIYLVYVNQVGAQDDLIFDGRSMVADPTGKIIFVAEPFREGLRFVDLPFPHDPSRPSVRPRADKTAELYEALRLGVRDYVSKNGFRRTVVGLSGGIDSALTCTLAADALGPWNVLGVAMPGPYSSARSERAARALAKGLGIEYRVHPITQFYALKMRMGKLKRGTIHLPLENYQARLRALELMYLSNLEGRLLLSTGNKSEMAMGYSTLYGDMCGGLSVLGDVYKTQVYELARYRNRLKAVIPLDSLRRAPSAELRPNQKDSDSLPPYPLLDEILKRYVEAGEARSEIARRIAGRASEKLVRRVCDTVDHNEYKRRQAPPTLRVSRKAWFGRRMPITNRFRE